MQLAASKTAQFLTQNEFNHVELDDNVLVVSSHTLEERIPFNVWNGKVAVKRGLLWSGLQFFAHESEGRQQSWLVQGLSLASCRKFAKYAVEAYQVWHEKQCRDLFAVLPQWEQAISGFVRQHHSFLIHHSIAG